MTKQDLKEQILKARAKQFLKPIADEKVVENQINGLEFMLSNERYAIDATYIKEVVFINALTNLPCTPNFILGIINLRGSILSVIDIKKFFNLPSQGITNLNKVIIVKHHEIEFGILVDDICGDICIDLDTIQTNTVDFAKNYAEYLLGVSKDRLIVLDIVKLLESDKIIVNERLI